VLQCNQQKVTKKGQAGTENNKTISDHQIILRSVPMDGVSQVRAFTQGIKVPELMAVKSNIVMND